MHIIRAIIYITSVCIVRVYELVYYGRITPTLVLEYSRVCAYERSMHNCTFTLEYSRTIVHYMMYLRADTVAD